MKKIVSFFLCLIIIYTFSGCKKNSEILPITSDFSFTADVTYNNETFCYKAEIIPKTDNKIMLKSTDTATNITYTFFGQQITEELFGIKNTRDISSLPESSVLDLLYFVFSDIRENSKTVTNTDNEYFIESKIMKYDYKITFGASGIPIDIHEKNFNIDVNIKDAKLL